MGWVTLVPSLIVQNYVHEMFEGQTVLELLYEEYSLDIFPKLPTFHRQKQEGLYKIYQGS